MLQNESAADLGTDVKASEGDLAGTITSKDFGTVPTNNVFGTGKGKTKRAAGSMAALSGGQHMSYVEQNKNPNRKLAKEPPARHKLFEKRQREEAARKKAARKAGGGA